MKKAVILTLATLLLSGCGITNSIRIENDIVMKTKRVTYSVYFSANQRYEPYYSQDISFVKETDKNNRTTYTIFDVITLPVESFDIEEDKLYMIIDDDVISFPTTYVKQYDSRKITEKKGEIMKSDSTKVSVVTGYDVVNKKTIHMTHILSDEIVEKIRKANVLNLRYYMGASYINSEIKKKKMENLKKMIDN
ncbi:MAG: hypothetical protein ACK5L7_01640 [Paludibacteraceae bacterium]